MRLTPEFSGPERVRWNDWLGGDPNRENEMALKLSVETIDSGGIITLIAEVRHGCGKWYRSEVDIVEPMTAMDLPNALRQLGDALERILRAGAPND